MLPLVDAFESLAPVSNDYAHLPVSDAFDWTDGYRGTLKTTGTISLRD